MDFVASVLATNKAQTTDAVRNLESINSLLDILIDCKDAPQRVGSILAQLVKIKVGYGVCGGDQFDRQLWDIVIIILKINQQSTNNQTTNKQL